MALNPTIITWSGKDINQMLQLIYNDSLFYTKFGALKIASVKSEYFYFDISNTFDFVTPTCCPTMNDNVDLIQRTGTICGFEMTGSICYRDLINTPREVKMLDGMNRESVLQDTELVSKLTEDILKTASTKWDDIILNGAKPIAPALPSNYLELCDGLRTKWAADANVITVAKVAITSANVIAQLQRVIDAIPNEIYDNPSKPVKIAVSTAILRAYRAANANILNPNLPVTQAAPLEFQGFEIVPLAYLPADEMFATFSDNIMLVYDSESDVSTLEFYDKGAYSACKEVDMVLNFRGAVDYGYGQYIVWYS